MYQCVSRCLRLSQKVLVQVSRQGIDLCALGELCQSRHFLEPRDLHALACLVASHLLPLLVYPWSVKLMWVLRALSTPSHVMIPTF